ncbi:MAG TPA: tRNA preQ1(34) S-adenosylmethionine ribosyltransferase-isomerase QueA [Candidatus Dormibacteraeota bacterium]
MPTTEFDYELPPERIAQQPLAERDAARLLHLVPDGRLEDRRVTELPELLQAGDLLVRNDTRVRAARLRARRAGGGGAELLVLTALGEGRYACLVRPARRLPAGAVVEIRPDLTATIGAPVPGHPGARAVRLECAGGGDVDAAIERAGSVPLPPYIHTQLADPERYQTVYSRHAPAVSAAAPTAGLHFTEALLGRLEERGVALTTVRLEVGLGTFTPIRAADAAAHTVHEERYELPRSAAQAVAATRARGGRVIAVGTTTVRVLETRAAGGGQVEPGCGTTRLYLRPGVELRVVDGLLTNFHQPRSSLLLLVAAVVGRECWRPVYDHALGHGYRFLSFGDCMLCWRAGPPGS